MKLRPERQPILLLSEEGASDVLKLTPSAESVRLYERGLGDSFDYEGSEFDSATWARLALMYPDVIKSFMMSPYDPISATALRSVAVAGQQIASLTKGSEGTPIENAGDWIEVTDDLRGGALAMLAREDLEHPPRLLVKYSPATGDYSVQVRVSPPCVERMLEQFERGAWELSSLNGSDLGVRRIIAEEDWSEAILAGARVLYVPADAGFVEPKAVLISRGRKRGRPVVQFWTPWDGQDSVKGSSTSLIVDDNNLERLTGPDIIGLLHDDAMSAWGRGKQPAVAFDLDGTLFNARRFAAQIFKEWLEAYEGPDAEGIRTLAADNDLLEGWNSRTILRDLGVTREGTLEDAGRHFNENFYSPTRRLEMPVIEGTVEFVKVLQSMGIKTVYVTLRSEVDDSLPGGTSVAKGLLERAGIWDEESVMLRHDGARIDWSEEAYKKGGNEPEKSRMVKTYRKANPDDYFIATVDNAPDHVLKYRWYFGYGIKNIHIRGDYPPNSPDVPDGVYSVEPNQLHRELVQWRDAVASSARDLAKETISWAGRMKWAATSPFYWDYTERHEEEIEDSAAKLKALFGGLINHAWAQPFVEEFLGAINRNYAGEPGGLEFFEDVIGVVNHRTRSSFVSLRGPEGISRIVWSEGGRVPQFGRSAPLPAGFKATKVRLKRGISVHDLASVLPGIEQGPDLQSMGARERYDMLSFGDYPRMAALLNSLVGMLCAEGGMNPWDITSTEYGPKMAIGAMIALARFGVSVGWREINSLKRIQTEQELRRLPDDLRFKIQRVPDEGGRESELSIWNLPHIGTSLKDMAAKTRRGGIVIAQTQMSPVDYERENLDHRVLVNMSLGSGQYVLPSAFLHVPNQFVNMPLSLQAWRVM